MNTLEQTTDWYKDLSFYEIWTRSFADGRRTLEEQDPEGDPESPCLDDGIGDLYGVYEKLPYIRSLGVDGIWFAPIYPSPNSDYGYDISDYRNVHPDFGTLDQFRKVLKKAHELGLKVLMDLVINHTSDEHPWFQESRKSRDNPYSDYYIWRDKPNNWDSFLEGKAWEYCPERNQYYLHLFSKKQPDLNMDNPKVRQEIRDIMRYWLDMGVDGFREDVITFISKKEGLPNGLPFVPIINGLPFYNDGPHLREYLTDMRKVCQEYNAVQIGEAPMTTVKSALSYIAGPDKVLDMMISFDQMTADCLFTEYIHLPFRLTRLKSALSRWQYGLQGKGWNALYLENHDHPRVISRYGNEGKYWKESGKALAAAFIFLQGTPFIYQGQELGMTNIHLRKIEHYADVSSKNTYRRFFTFEKESKRIARINISSRDSARTPVQWSGERYAGFSTHRPWFWVNRNYRTVNAETEEKDPGSILNFYKACLRLRKSSTVLRRGSYREYAHSREDLYLYERRLGEERILVMISFAVRDIRVTLPAEYRNGRAGRGQLLLDSEAPETYWQQAVSEKEPGICQSQTAFENESKNCQRGASLDRASEAGPLTMASRDCLGATRTLKPYEVRLELWKPET